MIQFRLPPAPARPLPVAATIRRAYELLWEHRFLEMRLMLAPLVLLAVAGALQSRVSDYFLTLNQLATKEEVAAMIQQISPGLIFAWAGTMLLGVGLLISFSVSWRRFLLLKEPPTAFYFHRPFWRYLGFSTAFYVGLVMVLVCAAIVISVPLMALDPNTNPLLFRSVFSFLLIAVLIAAVAWIVRYILLFTAITVDNRGLTWHDAAQAMQGNVIRYCLAWAGTIAPLLVLGNIFALTIGVFGIDLETTTGVIIFSTIQAVISVLQISLGASLGALIYDFLLRGGGPASSTDR